MFTATMVADLIREYFAAPFIETLRRETVFMDILDESQIKYGEKDIRWKINYAGNSSVGSYSETASFGSAGQQSYATALLDWKLNKAVIRVTGLAQALSEGPNSIINAITTETEQALRDLKRNMNLQLLSDGVGNLNGVNPALDATGDDLTGIQAAIDDGSSVTTYANIDRTTNAWWQSYVLSNSGVPRPLTESLMFQVSNEIETRGGKVTHILCSPDVWTQYGLLLTQERRQPDPGDSLKGGFKTLDFQGIPVVKVPSYEANRMDFIDKDQIEYLILRDFDIEPRDPGSYDAMQFFVKNYSQLKYKNPWKSGSLRDIAV
jgi:hypothetical protein